MQISAPDQSAEFEAAVLDSFKFLDADYGFMRRSSRPQKYTQLIVYENTEIYVALSYGPPAYEPEMSFGRRGIDDIPGAYSFHAGDLVKLDCCRNWTWNKNHGSTIVGWVAEFARLLSVCGAECLAANPLIFAQMKARRDKLVVEWRHNEVVKGVRAEIELAWNAKDYKQVLHLYTSIDELSELDKKRITVAKARI